MAAAIVVALLRIVFDVPADLPGNRSFGLHEFEHGTNGEGHAWASNRAVMRLPIEGTHLILALNNGHPVPAERPVDVSVRVDGKIVFDRRLDSSSWIEERIPVKATGARTVLIETRASPAFRPFRDFRRLLQLERSQDPRELGVALGPVVWE